MERSREELITQAQGIIAELQTDRDKRAALKRQFSRDQLMGLLRTLAEGDSADQELARHVAWALMPRRRAAAVNLLDGEDIITMPEIPEIPRPIPRPRPRAAAAAAAAAAVVNPLDREDEDIVIDDNVNVSVEMLRCPICLVNVKDIKLTCGHMLCKSCAKDYRRRNNTTCPQCRQDITSMDRVYYKKYLKYKNKYLQLKN